MAALLNPDVTHGTYNNADSAQRLVKGIALQNKVALFLSGSEADATENEVIVLDLLSALGLSPRIVNVASDADMHLGLPQRDGAADLPHLYLGGMAFGGIQTILDAARDGSLTTSLTRAGIPFDADAASSARFRPLRLQSDLPKPRLALRFPPMYRSPPQAQQAPPRGPQGAPRAYRYGPAFAQPLHRLL